MKHTLPTMLSTRTRSARSWGTRLLVSILLVPPAMTVWGSYQNVRLRSMVERTWAELDEAIEGVHRQYEEAEEGESSPS